jgi:formylglycine-generating enzyme required for sulfatase activity
MAEKPPDAFLSYTRFDDEYHGGAISAFRAALSQAVRAMTARTFEIFQDVDGIGLGENWRKRLDIALGEARFFIPILTPSFFQSEACRTELQTFLEFEAESGRDDLILPIYWLPCRVLEDAGLRASDTLAEIIHDRQRSDWRKRRHKPYTDPEVREALEALAEQIEQARARADRASPPPNARTRASEAGHRSQPANTALRDIDEPWCPEMVEIPAGQFMMGSPESDSEAGDAEKPPHLVRLERPVLVGRCPVTFEEYDHFCRATRRQEPDDKSWGRGRRPVIDMSWNDAKAYTEWLAGESGRAYRLLSEAEWEYACRAGTTTRYWWGDEIAPENANFGGNVSRTRQVGAYPGSPWGLFDMHGNVWEWVEDRWHDNYDGAPSDGSAWTWTKGKESRVLRGGSWGSDPVSLRSASRIWYSPSFRINILGFRVARTLTS